MAEIFQVRRLWHVTQGNITKTLREVFGANPRRDGKAGRHLKFYLSFLDKLSKVYDVPTEIKVTSVVSTNKKKRRKQKKSPLQSKNKQICR